MDKLFNCCNKWKLKLNTTKSKIVVFRKGNVAPRQSWKFGNDDIEAVNSLSYLGVLFSSNGLFTQAQCKLADQANKAVFTLYKRINTFKNLKTSVCIDLFDKFISPILIYSSEVWGFHKAKEIEQVHLNFCKRLLHVKRTTQNDFVNGELGWYPMYIFRFCRIISYWLKIITGKIPLYITVISWITCQYWCLNKVFVGSKDQSFVVWEWFWGSLVHSRSRWCKCVLYDVQDSVARYVPTGLA